MLSPSFRFHGAIHQWLPTADGLKLKRSGCVVAEVVPDERYPSMFRVNLLGRPISDMVNLSRAKDGALRLADHALQNRPRCAAEPRPCVRMWESPPPLAATVGRIGVPTKRKIGDRR
jgi:hypothetical protein